MRPMFADVYNNNYNRCFEEGATITTEAEGKRRSGYLARARRGARPEIAR